MAKKLNTTGIETDYDPEMEQRLYAAHAEVESFSDLETQRGTPIPALFNQFHKFIQNPSTVSVETYKRMVDTDDTIGSGVDFLTTCLAARLGRYTHPNEEVTEFVNKALDRIEGGWYDNFKELLSASWVGFAVQEKVWENTDEGYFVKKLVTLPPGTILFETGRTGEITEDGILQYQRNYVSGLAGLMGGGFGGAGYGFDGLPNPDPYAKLGDFPFPLRSSNTAHYLSIRIPRLKCVHYAFNAQGKFGNPYGRSLLRRAYQWYTLKHAFLKMMAVALDRKGTPLTVVYVDPNTTLLDPSQYDSSKPPGQQRKQRADLAAQAAFKNVHNDSVIFLPGKKGQIFDVESISQASNADDFMKAIDMCNKSILRALLIPSLIFGNGDGTGSYSLGQEHAKTFDKICDGMLEGAKQVYLQQVVKELLAYNFPESVWKKEGLGNFGKRELTKDEIDKEMEMFEKGINNGIISSADLNDLNKMRETIGFEPIEQSEQADMQGTEPQVDEQGNAIPVQQPADGQAPLPGAQTPGAESITQGNEMQDTALNGAQVTSMIEVVTSVAEEIIPRETGVLMLQKAFNLSPEEANAIMGTVGNGFKSSTVLQQQADNEAKEAALKNPGEPLVGDKAPQKPAPATNQEKPNDKDQDE